MDVERAQAAEPEHFHLQRPIDTVVVERADQIVDAMDADGTRQKIMEKYGVWDESLTRENMLAKP